MSSTQSNKMARENHLLNGFFYSLVSSKDGAIWKISLI